MQQTTLLKETEDQVVFTGGKAYLGTKRDYKTTDTDTGLVSHHSVLTPIQVRTEDRNTKYDTPHQSTKEKSRRLKQHGN